MNRSALSAPRPPRLALAIRWVPYTLCLTFLCLVAAFGTVRAAEGDAPAATTPPPARIATPIREAPAGEAAVPAAVPAASAAEAAQEPVAEAAAAPVAAAEPAPAPEPVTVASFVVTDYLNRDWQHEIVTFPVDGEVFERDDVALVDADGAPVLFQWTRGGEGGPAIAFFATVPPLGRREWRLLDGAPVGTLRTPEPAAKITRTADALMIGNDLVGLMLPLKEKAQLTGGPIASVRLGADGWFGGSTLSLPPGKTTCQVAVVEEGPIFVDAMAYYDVEGQGQWSVRFRFVRDEPVILVQERGGFTDGGSWEMALGAGKADRLFSRGSAHNDGQRVDHVPAKAGEKPLFVLEAWSKWWMQRPRGNWFGTFREGDKAGKMLVLGAYNAGAWRDPGSSWDTNVPVLAAPLRAQFQLRGPGRNWMIAAVDPVAAMANLEDRQFAPLPQQLLIKYGDVPLDMVKNYLLAWKSTNLPHPRLFLEPGNLDAIKAAFSPTEEDLVKLRRTKLSIFNTDDVAAAYLATGDVELEKILVNFALEHLQKCVNLYTEQGAFPTLGTEPPRHYMQVGVATSLADILLMDGVLRYDEEERVRAQLAFLGYTLARPDVIDPSRGYGANPNMTTMSRSALGMVACLIPDHPSARSWVGEAITQWEKEMNRWSGPNGGWLEAPHYAAASLSGDIALALALRNSGFVEEDPALNPKLRLSVAWLAKLSTPPDARMKGERTMPAIGNSYTGEQTVLPGWMARIWRTEDPEFAGHMQWVWEQQGEPTTPGIGGFFPATAGFNRVMTDPTIRAISPPFGSELFPSSGAIMRAHFPGPFEMYLHYIQGPHHAHYDYDEGSIVFWGKGQPLIQEFGYYGRAPADEHSMVHDGSPRYLGREGKIETFTTSAGADYLLGKRGGITRQILFVKDENAGGANYVLLNDAVKTGRESDWRIWVPTAQDLTGKPEGDAPSKDAPLPTTNAAITPAPASPLRVIGRDEADLAVWFSVPGKPDTQLPIYSERITRRTGASNFKSLELTQRSVHVKLPKDGELLSVLYPLLKNQETPSFEMLADGRGVRIRMDGGIDYAFLGSEPFEYKDNRVSFSGVAGLVQLRPSGTRVTLPDGGTIMVGDTTVEGKAGEAVSQKLERP